MKRLIGVLLVVALMVGVTGAVAEMSQKEASETMANTCLDVANEYLEEYNKREDKPEEFLALAYHYYCAFREFRAIYRVASGMEFGTGLFDIRSIEKAFFTAAITDDMLDDYYVKWANGEIEKDQVAMIMGVVIPGVSKVGASQEAK